jgi:hypothetical protein
MQEWKAARVARVLPALDMNRTLVKPMEVPASDDIADLQAD